MIVIVLIVYLKHRKNRNLKIDDKKNIEMAKNNGVYLEVENNMVSDNHQK